jgi:putative aldouronate transport system substrate-binding protein
MRPPLYGGGGFAPTTQSMAANNFTALKKASTTRIRQLLQICNWLAAPFGTQEYLFRKFGIAGTDYHMQSGSPLQTQTGVTETALGIRYIVDSPDVLFVPGHPQAARKAYEYQASVIPTSVKDPTFGLFSNAWSTKQAALSMIINNARNDILQGRQQVSSWDNAVKAWQQGGGNQVRNEYEQQLQKAGGPTS